MYWQKKKLGVKIVGKNIGNIRFADDMTLFLTFKNSLMMLLQTVSDSSTQQGLLLNTKKIKVMVIDGGCTDFLQDRQGIGEIEDSKNVPGLQNYHPGQLYADQEKTGNNKNDKHLK